MNDDNTTVSGTVEEIPQKAGSENLVPVQDGSGTISQMPLVEYALSTSKAKLDILDDMWKYALSRLKPGHLNKMHGLPYLNSKGAKRVARGLGISWSIETVSDKIWTSYPVLDNDGKPVYKDGVLLEFKHYRIEAILKGSWKIETPNGVYEADSCTEIGICCTEDDWFLIPKLDKDGKQIKIKKLDNKYEEKVLISPDWWTVDQKNVSKKAVTNGVRRLIMSITGYIDPTWKELLDYANITPEMIDGFSSVPATSGQITFIGNLLEQKISDYKSGMLENEEINKKKAQATINYLKERRNKLTTAEFMAWYKKDGNSNKLPTTKPQERSPEQPPEPKPQVNNTNKPQKKHTAEPDDITIAQWDAIESMVKSKCENPTDLLKWLEVRLETTDQAGKAITILNGAGSPLDNEDFTAKIKSILNS